MPTSFTTTNFDPINYDYELLNTDLDFDNLFEPDTTTDGVLIDSNNFIKLETSANLNEAYLSKSNDQLLNINTIKIALKNLKIPVKADEQEKIRAHDPGGTSPQITNGVKTENSILRANVLPVCTKLGTSESLANITSTTLTPPSPLTPNEIKVKKEDTTNSTIPQALNKFTILSNSQQNQNASRFNSLNKVKKKASNVFYTYKQTYM